MAEVCCSSLDTTEMMFRFYAVITVVKTERTKGTKLSQASEKNADNVGTKDLMRDF